MPRESRKRRRSDVAEEEHVVGKEDGEMVDRVDDDSTGDDTKSDSDKSSDDDGDTVSRRRSSGKKKAKKAKKAKKKKKKHHRSRKSGSVERSSSKRKRSRRHRSSSEENSEEEEEDDSEAAVTDREGGSTPELPDLDEAVVLVKQQPAPAASFFTDDGSEEGEIEEAPKEDLSPIESDEDDRSRSLSREKRSSRKESKSSSVRGSRRQEGRRHEGEERQQQSGADKVRGKLTRGSSPPARSDDRKRGSVADAVREKLTRRSSPPPLARSDNRQRGSVADAVREKLTRRGGSRSPPRGSTRPTLPKPVPSKKDEKKQEEDREEEGADMETGGSGGGGALSLSVAETNELRAKLGLAPLKVDVGAQGQDKKDAEEAAIRAGGTLIPNSNTNEVHIPAINISQKTEAEKIRERIKQRRQKREQESKLLTLKKLGDSDGEDDASNWVERQKKRQKEKDAAAKRAKVLEELDDEFGVGSLVKEEAEKERAKEYTRADLKGLKVEHSVDRFSEGRDVILTLKDADILDETAQDTLVNVNLMDDERTEKKIEDVRKAKVGYNAYDLEEVDELTGQIKRKNMLDKYDEEIDGVQRDTFMIGDFGGVNEEERMARERDQVRARLKLNAKTLETLELPQMRIASDYLTSEEQAAKFKKPKKVKRKVKRKMFRADELLCSAAESFGSRSSRRGEQANIVNTAFPMDIDPEDTFEVKPDKSSYKVDDEEDDLGLEKALQRSRRMQQRRAVVDVADLLLSQAKEENPVKEEEEMTGSEFIATFDDDEDEAFQKTIILNETAEFCRNLGARQMNYGGGDQRGAEGAENVDSDLIDFENSLKSRATRQYEERRGRWEEVEDDDDDEAMDTVIDLEREDGGGGKKRRRRDEAATILDEEPDLQQGVAAAIKLANSKGYWEKEEQRKTGSNLLHLQAKNYTIDDKVKGGDDDRGSRRGERYGGPTQPFQDKPGYIPNVKLEYIDDGGRMLNQKEAFRYLSHKFHGKGSGKMKTEKRMKKVMEEGLMKNMSSTDTPLNTLEKLKKKQEACATPYIVLTGNKINSQDLKKF